MFQPNPEKIIPKIIRAKVVPVWVLAAIVATQISINAVNQDNKPNCRINVHNVHSSTHSKKYLAQSDAKVKISTECDAPQEKTSLTVVFEEEMPDGTFQLVSTRKVDVRPEQESPNVVFIKDVTVPCNFKGEATYQARAEGQVRLRDGQVEEVSGMSPKPWHLRCRISAK